MSPPNYVSLVITYSMKILVSGSGMQVEVEVFSFAPDRDICGILKHLIVT